MATALASNLRHSSFADLKIICSDGSAWAHRLVLAAVSPVLRCVFLLTYLLLSYFIMLLCNKTPSINLDKLSIFQKNCCISIQNHSWKTENY